MKIKLKAMMLSIALISTSSHADLNKTFDTSAISTVTKNDVISAVIVGKNADAYIKHTKNDLLCLIGDSRFATHEPPNLLNSNIVNMAVSGMTVEILSELVEKGLLNLSSCKKIALIAGINDVLKDGGINLHETMPALLQALPKVKVTLFLDFTDPEGLKNYQARDMATRRAIWYENRTLTNACLFRVKGGCEIVKKNMRAYLVDGIHQNKQGEILIARALNKI